MPANAPAARARAARASIASPSSGGAKSCGGPQASTCQISPWLFRGAWISAPGMVVKPSRRSARVSVTGKPCSGRKWSDRHRNPQPIAR